MIAKFTMSLKLSISALLVVFAAAMVSPRLDAPLARVRSLHYTPSTIAIVPPLSS